MDELVRPLFWLPSTGISAVSPMQTSCERPQDGRSEVVLIFIQYEREVSNPTEHLSQYRLGKHRACFEPLFFT